MTSDHALMTNFCLTKLLISTNVTLSFACFTETAIDVYIFANYRPMSDLLYLVTDYMFYKLRLSAFFKE